MHDAALHLQDAAFFFMFLRDSSAFRARDWHREHRPRSDGKGSALALTRAVRLIVL